LLEEDIFRLDEIVIQQQLSALNVISKIDLETTVNSSRNLEESTWTIYRNTPVEEAANISRGFDIDHGTDIAISVDGCL
jgi:hypothetical protein